VERASHHRAPAGAFPQAPLLLISLLSRRRTIRLSVLFNTSMSGLPNQVVAGTSCNGALCHVAERGVRWTDIVEEDLQRLPMPFKESVAIAYKDEKAWTELLRKVPGLPDLNYPFATQHHPSVEMMCFDCQASRSRHILWSTSPR
jgi:hypothetical protein